MLKWRYQKYALRVLLLLLCLAVGLLTAASGLLQRLDWVLYDSMLPVLAEPVSDEIVVVAIDDDSLRELGRWPWSRAVHAKLIRQLTRLEAGAIGIDILFSEADTGNLLADRQFELALLDNGRSVLAVAPDKSHVEDLIGELLPIPALATAAAGLGHVDVELDVDGLCRSTYLYAGLQEARWPSLPLAMLQVAGKPPESASKAPPANRANNSGWLRQQKILIPFSRTETYRQLSYADVLAGRVSRDAIKGKLVLVGATAAGLGDAISTPGAFSHERMPGILLNVEILNALLQQRTIDEIAFLQSTLLSVLLTGMTVAAVTLLPATFSLLAYLSGLLLSLVLSLAMLKFGLSWFPPAATLSAITVSWPLWWLWKIHHVERQRQQLLRQLEKRRKFHLATGLPNAQMLTEELSTLSGNASRGCCGLMIIHINWPGSASVVIDRPISDPVLDLIGRRLREITDNSDFIAHLSGDDFAVLSCGHADEQAVLQASEKLLQAMQQPLAYRGEMLLLAPQIGLSIWPRDTHDSAALLRNAYTAMFKSRIDEIDPLCVYSANIGHELHKRSQLEQALLAAMERDEFELFFQPQVDIRSHQIVGVEALLRWNNPQLGWVAPDTFIPVAEHIGLIKPLGQWVLEAACFQLYAWKQAGLGRLRMAINVSPLQFMVSGLDQQILHILEKYDLNPGDIELEITESLLMRDREDAVRKMHRLKESGITLAIDDFGTGYSSLSNLSLFPLDHLKIDKSFTQAIGMSAENDEITQGILSMAKNLHLNVIAEGVETPEQADFLRRHGCDELQGFLISRPLNAEDMTQRLT